jgi:4-hydroxybenzoate polyprenyltransferase
MTSLRDYAQLVRLPNLPSALADICLGALAAGALPGNWLAWALLLPASACLYCAGMVFNDYFDREQDRRERPFRPIPSERVKPEEARRLGAALMAGGVLCAMLAGLAAWSAAPPILAGLLVGAIFLYDAAVKRTWAGPVAMGLCRALNVLLGVSASGGLGGLRGFHLAAVVGVYVAGVTWFARTEARVSSQAMLRGAAAVMLGGLLLALPLPLHPDLADARRAVDSSPLFPYLLVALGFVVGVPVCRAIAAPTPANVQAAVKRSLLCLIVLDAVLATALVGSLGLVLLVLLAPGLYLARQPWMYAT